MSITSVLCVLLITAMLMLWLLYRSSLLRQSLHREREENRRLRILLQMGSQAAQADLAQLQQLRHDLRQYLILAEDSSLPAQTAALLQEAVKTAPSAGGRENWAVSAMEQHYQKKAQALGFQADLKIISPQSWEELMPDLYLVLGNLLENSLEALQREGGGWLRARSISAAGYFSLVVGNTCSKPLQLRGGRYLSSKTPGRFGIGLETVREVAERYGGQAEFTVEDGAFRASVFLPRPEAVRLETPSSTDGKPLASV